MKRFCQSCSLPMEKDPAGGGTDADGRTSDRFCSLCWRDGAFAFPEIDSPRKMQAFCVRRMTEGGMSPWLAWVLTRGIPRLERWRPS